MQRIKVFLRPRPNGMKGALTTGYSVKMFLRDVN
jgi:hypothetical protein